MEEDPLAGAVPASQNRDFYAILDIDRSADVDTIKRAYRRAALRNHPDKVGQSPEAVEKFQNIVRAHEVLTDEKSRRIYDEYGERGLMAVQTMGQYAPFLDPDLLFRMNYMFMAASLTVSLALVFAAYVAVRADGRRSWNWGYVFIPLFLVDLGVLAEALYLRKQAQRDGRAARTSDDDEEERLAAERDAAAAAAARSHRTHRSPADATPLSPPLPHDRTADPASAASAAAGEHIRLNTYTGASSPAATGGTYGSHADGTSGSRAAGPSASTAAAASASTAASSAPPPPPGAASDAAPATSRGEKNKRRAWRRSGTTPTATDDVDHDHDDHDGGPGSRHDASGEPGRELAGRVAGAVLALTWLLLVAFQVLLVIRLNADEPGAAPTRVTWVDVFIPWFILEALGALEAVITFVVMARVPVYDASAAAAAAESGLASPAPRTLNAWELLELAATLFSYKALRIVQALLIGLRGAGTITCDWGVVFIPAYLVGVVWLVGIVHAHRAAAKQGAATAAAGGADPAAERRSLLAIKLVVFVLFAVLFYTFLGLLIRRTRHEGVASPTAAVIMIPVFIVLASLFLCVCCCLPCMVCCTRMAFQMEDERDDGVTLISPQRRITEG